MSLNESQGAFAVGESSQARAMKTYTALQIPKSLSSHSRGDDSSYVAKAFHNDQFIGTFTFIGERMVVIDFHVVFFPKDECILEDSLTLRIGGNTIKVEHMVSYPHYNISIYKLDGGAPPCKFLEIEDELIAIGEEVVLISFPLLGEGDCNDLLHVIFNGRLEQVVSPLSNSFLLVNYECYPGSSGGPVVSRRTGKLIGIHIGNSVFHEDTTYNVSASLTPRQSNYPLECGAVRCLAWKPPVADVDVNMLMNEASNNSQEGCEGLKISISDALDTFALSFKDVREVNFYAASNAFRKGHHACFLSASTLKILLSVETFAAETLVKRVVTVSKRGSWKNDMRRKTLYKKWRKQMRNLRRLLRAVKVHDCA